jgi:hypothetical protein
MSYRANLTDKAQSELEAATFENGISVFEDAKTRVIAKGVETAPQRTANAGSTIRNNAGVVMPWNDRPDKFLEKTQGKRA